MHIEHNHRLGAAEAIGRINALLDDLLRRQLPAGVTVQEISRNWSENALSFSFRASKGIFGATSSGVLHVNDDSMILDFDLPGWVTSFIGEDKIRDTIHQQLDDIFPA